MVTKVERACRLCGASFWARPIDVQRGATLCSTTCRSMARRLGPVRSTSSVQFRLVDGSECACVRLASYPDHEILLDPVDLDWFLDFERGWIISRRDHIHYVVGREFQYLHRRIVEARIVDHINGNGLDNRRCNLRPVTNRQNCTNWSVRQKKTSQYMGVSLIRKHNRWTGQIRDETGRKWGIGWYKDEETCAIARDAVADFVYGEYTRLNFPDRLAEGRQLVSTLIERIKAATHAD